MYKKTKYCSSFTGPGLSTREGPKATLSIAGFSAQKHLEIFAQRKRSGLATSQNPIHVTVSLNGKSVYIECATSTPDKNRCVGTAPNDASNHAPCCSNLHSFITYVYPGRFRSLGTVDITSLWERSKRRRHSPPSIVNLPTVLAPPLLLTLVLHRVRHIGI
jgi:hypothetical protein